MKSLKPTAIAAQAYKQKADDFAFEEDATREGIRFQNLVSLTYGPPKIGKSTLWSLMPGVYFLPTEPGYKALKIRKTYIPNWPTFTRFIKMMARKPKLCKTVKVFCIDTSDNLAKFCMQWVCGREGIAHPQDQEWGKGWEAYRDEFTYWILQLANLGAGVAFISHETEREVTSHSMKVTKTSPSLPKTCYTVINNLVDITLKMGYVQKKKGRKGHVRFGETRCLFTKPSATMDAGDRSGRLPNIIKFTTEQEAVDQILACFTTPKKHKKFRRPKR